MKKRTDSMPVMNEWQWLNNLRNRLLAASPVEQPAAAQIESKIVGYRWRWPNSLSPNRWYADMRDNQVAYCQTMVEEMSARGAVAELVYSAPAPSPADERAAFTDEKRYQRLRILGVAPFDSAQLAAGTVLRFQSLDAYLDADIKRHPSRGEYTEEPSSAASANDKD